MTSSPTIPAPAEPATVSTTPIPANEYQRFLAALPESLRNECHAQLTGSGFSANHPVFKALADFYEKAASPPEPEQKKPALDFFEEARLHAGLSRQLLNDFQKIPQTILARVEPQLLGLLAALTGPVEKLESTATHLQRNVEALPVLLLRRRSLPCPPFNRWRDRLKWWLRDFPRQARWAFSDHMAWIVVGSICATLAFAVTANVLAAERAHLARAYEKSYQERLARMEADSVENTVALNRLLVAGITLKVERSKEGDSYFLILPGARKAAQPVNSPEGLAVEVWP